MALLYAVLEYSFATSDGYARAPSFISTTIALTPEDVAIFKYSFTLEMTLVFAFKSMVGSSQMSVIISIIISLLIFGFYRF